MQGREHEHVHFVGICGYAVSGAALLAKDLGYMVSGSDEHAYPPITTIVAEAGIPWSATHEAANLTRYGVPDIVVVGNHIQPGNVELEAVEKAHLPKMSEIEFFVKVIGARKRIAICGTHGKTTTASLLALMLEKSGLDPGFRIGGIAKDFGIGTRLGSGPFVFEGDEYSTAPWDRRPKFYHIKPEVACLVAVEWDHPDIYPSLNEYLAPFAEMVAGLPPDGSLILGSDDPVANTLKGNARCTVETYGTNEDATWQMHSMEVTLAGQTWVIQHGNEAIHVSMLRPGAHDARNATAAFATAMHIGADPESCIRACAVFKGPGRRFERIASASSVVIIDDYAHHPTEVRVVLDAAKRQYPNRRIIAVHTPHTYTRTKALLEEYRYCCRSADVVVLGPIDAARERGKIATVTSEDVKEKIPAPSEVILAKDADEALSMLSSMLRADDVVVVVSLSGFDEIAQRIAAFASKQFQTVIS